MPAVQMGRVLVPAVQKGVQCTQKITDVEIHPRKKKINCWIKTSSSLKRPALHILSKSSPPEAYSITIARWVGVNMT